MGSRYVLEMPKVISTVIRVLNFTGIEMKEIKKAQVINNKWFMPSGLLACCDCGLIHSIKFRTRRETLISNSGVRESTGVFTLTRN